MSEKATDDLVSLTIDDQVVNVPKGTTIIEAAKEISVSIPHYCYHSSLSIVGNCRICQVEVEGAPKLMIACHTQVQPDMKVRTHLTSQKVQDAQAATLEMILINHPLDCTVCDQSGHCKLQDYHFKYNAKPSRFIENKVKKVKAEPLGPTVMLDGERCIMCTRCIRFCDEITGTSELGMVNRGDRSMIAVNPGKELNNPFSGNVVDLCPVGALTHREWRFNTRIWYTRETDTICPGCSTGCNATVAVRDNQVVQVKARKNKLVNDAWLCDQGRYGFHKFIPEVHVNSAYLDQQRVDLDQAIKSFSELKNSAILFLIAPDLLLEDYYALKELIALNSINATTALAFQKRDLTELEKILISPDYAANYKGAEHLELIGEDPEGAYKTAIRSLSSNEYEYVVFIGDRAILEEDIPRSFDDVKVCSLISDQSSPLFKHSHVVLPARSLFQKSGLMINSSNRLQYSDRLIEFTSSNHPHWRLLNMISELLGNKITDAISDREMTLDLLSRDLFPESKPIRDIRRSGMSI